MNAEPYQAVNEWNPCQEELVATPSMVRARTVELAVAAGRGPLEISHRDYEIAKREVTGESEPNRQMAILYPAS